MPSWDAATLVIPWDLCVLYGDERILKEMYDTQKRLVDYTGTYFASESFTYDNRNNFFLGEYAVGAGFGAVPVDAVATAYYYHMLDLLAKSAEILEKGEERSAYRELAGKVRDAFNERYWDASRGVYRSGPDAPFVQALNVLPVAFGLAPDGHAASIVRQLNDDVVADGYHLGTSGIFSIRYLMTILSDHGFVDTAYRVARERTNQAGAGGSPTAIRRCSRAGA